MYNPKDFPRGLEIGVGPFILNDKNQVLLVQSTKKWGDTWLICGGHVEVGETSEEAVIRETREELGIELHKIYPLCFQEGIFYAPEFNRNAHFIFLNYVAWYKSGDFVLNDEISCYSYFDIDEALLLPNLKKTCYNSLLVVKKFLQNSAL